MKIHALLLLILFSSFTVSGQELDKAHQQVVQDFINFIKKQDKESLSEKTFYPFYRIYPISPVKDKQDFIARYAELFDDKLTEIILNSNPSKDWLAGGWRGMSLLNGVVWLDYDGRLTAINYKTAAESKRRNELIEADRSRLYSSIKVFEKPMAVLETKNLRIRIDDLGSGKYRYTAWPLKSSMKDKPDLILKNGERIWEGSGGNHKYQFKDGEYLYECAILNVSDMRSPSSPPALLIVQKDEKVLLKEVAKML